MKFFYICALLLPIIVSAYASRDDTLSNLKGKFRLNKIDENVNEEVNAKANVDHVPDESIALDGIDQMPSGLHNLDLKSGLSDIIGNLLKEAKLHEVPDMSVASDALDNNNVINEVNLKPDMSVVSHSEDNLVPDMPIATDDIKPDIFVFPDAEDSFVPDSPSGSNIFYKNLKIKGILNKINY